MKQIFTLLLATGLAVPAMAREAQLSPHTRHYLQLLEKDPATAVHGGFVYRKDAAGQLLISALVKVQDAGVALESLRKAGVSVGTRAGNIWTVQVPVQKVPDFIKAPGLAYIQMDEPVFPQLATARKTTRVDSVHQGIGLPMPYDGKNVVVGVIDFGFDYNHPDFYDTTGTKYRIKQVWELGTTGTPPTGYTYGHEIKDTIAIKQQGTDNVHQNHGTCVAGIAAGSGFGGAGSAYRGMAYAADLVMVGVRRDSIGGQWMQGGFSDFIDGVNYIFNYAGSVSKPAVVNISWGSQSGSHDGTSLFNQACDNLSGPGKLVVMSAGNEGEEKIHIAKQFTATDTAVSTFLTFTPANYKRTWVDVWGEPGKTFCGKVTLYAGNGTAGNTTGTICLDDLVHDTYLIGSNGLDTCYVQFINSTAEQNGKPRMTINIFSKTGDSVGVRVSGTSGAIHMWDEYYYYGFPYGFQSAFSKLGQNWAVDGNTDYTVSDMGSAESVLLVGAYCSKVGWTSINGSTPSYGSYATTNRMAPFSSHGPMVDGRIKPDIAAPGLTLATAQSSYDTAYTATGSRSDYVVASYVDPGSGKTYYFSEFIGTSASAPAASGIVGLLLQANPQLTPAALKDILGSTAIKDFFTGNLPPEGNNTWGKGKINAYAAIKKAIQTVGVYNYTGRKLDCVLFPNPNNGRCFIDYTGEAAEALHVEVYNITGTLVNATTWQVTPGLNRREMSWNGLASGTYLVKVTGRDGAVQMKMLVQ